MNTGVKSMIPKRSQGAPQAGKLSGNGKTLEDVQACLIDLRKRRSVLDALILSVERYSAYPTLPKFHRGDREGSRHAA
jgi:hypothetical protein